MPQTYIPRRLSSACSSNSICAQIRPTSLPHQVGNPWAYSISHGRRGLELVEHKLTTCVVYAISCSGFTGWFQYVFRGNYHATYVRATLWAFRIRYLFFQNSLPQVSSLYLFGPRTRCFKAAISGPGGKLYWWSWCDSIRICMLQTHIWYYPGPKRSAWRASCVLPGFLMIVLWLTAILPVAQNTFQDAAGVMYPWFMIVSECSRFPALLSG